MSKLITVFGATGNQGGSVIKSILADPQLAKEFKIRGITRDTSKPAAKALAAQGVETVVADLNSAPSVAAAIKGSHTVFLVTNYWETAQESVEKAQGINVADEAKKEGISHLIFSSLINVNKATNGRLASVPHFDGKAEIEDYIKETGVPSTFVLPGYFMINYLSMLRKGEDGVYTLAYPVSEAAKFPLFDAAEDLGKFTNAALKNTDRLNKGNQILAATAYYTPSEILSQFEEVTGKKTKYVQVTPDQYKSFLPPAVAEEFLENHLLIEEPGYYAGQGLEESLALLDEKPTTWKQFLERKISEGHVF